MRHKTWRLEKSLWDKPGFITAMLPKMEVPFMHAIISLRSKESFLSFFSPLAEWKCGLCSSIPANMYLYWEECAHCYEEVVDQMPVIILSCICKKWSALPLMINFAPPWIATSSEKPPQPINPIVIFPINLHINALSLAFKILIKMTSHNVHALLVVCLCACICLTIM